MSVWDMDKPVRLPWALLQATFPFLMAFAFIIFFINSPTSPSAPAPIGPFVGCYTDGRSSIVLGKDGFLRSEQKRIGRFYIVDAVGGKHGPLISAENVKPLLVGETVKFQPGVNNLYWEIDRKGNLSILIRDGYWDFKKTALAVCETS